jgi:hypothetical protein
MSAQTERLLEDIKAVEQQLAQRLAEGVTDTSDAVTKALNKQLKELQHQLTHANQILHEGLRILKS